MEKVGLTGAKVSQAELRTNPLVLETVFTYLPPQDIKTVALVCREWSSLVESVRFWRWAVLRIGSSHFRAQRACRRLKSVSHLSIHCRKLNPSQAQSVSLSDDVGWLSVVGRERWGTHLWSGNRDTGDHVQHSGVQDTDSHPLWIRKGSG